MSCKRDCFDTYHEVNNGAHIYFGDNRSHEIKGYGDISVIIHNVKEKQIQNVVYVLELKKNSMPVITITNKNLKVEFVKSHCLENDMQDNYKLQKE